MKKHLGKISLLLFVITIGCANSLKPFSKKNKERNYRDDMRNFVIKISEYAKMKSPNFVIIPQNGIELVTKTGTPYSQPSLTYMNAIDGHGQESLFFGYTGDNKKTPKEENEYTSAFLNLSLKQGNAILVTDYCKSEKKVKEAITKNSLSSYISYAAPERNLNVIPILSSVTTNENKKNITSLLEANNFLYLINYENFPTKKTLTEAIEKTNYDVLILDLFFNDGTSFSKQDVEKLKVKANGSKRMVVCYMSIGEAEDYRYYWNPDWDFKNPTWMTEENEDWIGNYKVKYWEKDWQKIILGQKNAYLDRIIATGFDGVYLDIIDGYEYFENL